jgi:8-amino-3,8-dideoxy-alpha-D-manno-octulosonate transaminase
LNLGPRRYRIPAFQVKQEKDKEVTMAKETGSQANKDSRAPDVFLGRRRFLAAAVGIASVPAIATEADGGGARAPASTSPAAPGRAPGTASLAIDGGTPVRPTKLEARLPGPLYYDDEERRELVEVLDHRSPFRWWGNDPKGRPPEKCISFEREFAAHQHAKYCVAVTSGTTALITAMAALEVGPGDEVILPAWTWYACYDAILAAGALPVFAEVDHSMNLDPTDVERHISSKTKVIMAVHILGEPADMDPILDIARKHNLKVLEDCAQSVGVTYKGRPVGSMGDCAIYSFQVNKTISAGEGGAVMTSDPYVFERAARFHDVGTLRDGHAQVLGQAPRMNKFSGGQYRMSEFTGAVMRAQLRKLDGIVADFRDKSSRIVKGVQDLPGLQFRKRNDPEGGLGSTVFIRTGNKEQRNRFIAALKAENIPAGPMGGSVILPIEPHIERKQTLQPDWPSFSTPQGKAIQYGAAACPRTIEIYNRYVGIPMDPRYADQDVGDIIAAVSKVYPAVMNS